MKVKRLIAIILVTAIVYTGLASLVAWLIIRNDRKNSHANNSTNIESVEELLPVLTNSNVLLELADIISLG